MADERDWEAEASEQGWTPKEDWKGDEAKWTNAQTFVERGEKIAGILKSRLDKQDAKIQSLQESNRQFGEYHKQTLEAQRAKDAKTVAELKEQLAQSVTDGDGQAYRRYSDEIDSLEARQPGNGETEEWTRLSKQWITDNPWYNANPKLHQYADDISDRIRATAMSEEDYFSKLTASVRENHPEEFTNPNKSKANAVDEGGQRSTKDSKAHTYENLTAEDKRACDDFVAEGFMTREDYVKNYEWD